jgi:DNA helicase HerA-like ATPase
VRFEGWMAGDRLWKRLEAAGAYRVTEIPRPDEGITPEEGSRSQADEGRSQRIAALAAAYHAGGLVAFGWVRTAAGGPVHVVAAGDALAGSRACGAGASAGADDASAGVLLALPGGARGTVLRPGELAGLFSRIGCWREIAGISDGLLAPDTAMTHSAGAARHAGPSLEEGLLSSWTEPFGWIVSAQPLHVAELRSLADEVARRQRLAEAAADRFPERAVDARRLAQRHAEVRRGVSAGFWRVRVLAGGCGETCAAKVAGLLCASVGLGGLPYALTPAPEGTDAAPTCHAGGDGASAAPFYGSTELLAALARPPRSEIPGLRLALRSSFDVTPEAPDAPRAIRLGDILDRNLMPAGPFTLPLDSLNRHVFVCGATGTGKSQTVRSLLEAATGEHIPWLVVEPAKAEYRLMANRVPGATVIRIRPGEADATAAGLNPLEPAGDGSARFALQTHADLVKALFMAAFRSEEPFPQVLSAALTRVYEEAGWDLALGEPTKVTAAYPTLTDLQRAAEQVVGEIGYSQRVTDDVLGFIRVRLASLRQGTTGRFLEGGHQIDFGALMRNNVVLEIEDVGDDRDKAFLMGTVLIRLAEHLRLTHRTTAPPGQDRDRRDVTLRHLTVVEEAHRLLRRPETAAGAAEAAGAGGYAVEMFAGLLAEIRAYGEGLVIAEQIPARLLPDVIKNTAVKITHRLPATDDRDAVGATMNATPEQSRYLVTLPTGQAAAFADGMDFPVLVKMKDCTERELAAVPRTVDARTVVSRRSATCGTECVSRPCTLREIRAAQRALAAPGWVAAWAELTVLAHLSGWPMPVPTPDRLAEFRQLPIRLSQCAISLAVDAAAAARAPAIDTAPDPAASPAALAAHACAAIRARAERDQWLCRPDEPEWRTAGAVTEAVAFGTARPSVIEAAGPLTALLGAFIDCRWPVPYLLRRSASPAPSAGSEGSPGVPGSQTTPGPP